ncbi:MAG: glycosyltransferase, partial [Clostridiales bacterium]|nr:glycosyltransferase [Clostridiales bacterium]
MGKIRLYIFVQDNYRGTSYGIGTYIEQIIHLTNCSKEIELTLIHFHSQKKKLKIEDTDNYKQIFIPNYNKPQNVRPDVLEKRYIRDAVTFLKGIIPDDPHAIFHFQFLDQYVLIKSIKKMFSGKIVLTVHYTDWSLNLLGDKKHLDYILHQPADQLDSMDKLITGLVERDKKTLQLCNQVICIARHSYDYIIDILKVEKNKVCIIPHGIKDGYYPISQKKRDQLRNRFWISKSQKIILFAGRLDEVKGIAYLIKSFEKLLITHPEAHLVLVGDGYFNKWFPLINNCWTKITFTGKLNKRQLYNWYKIADIGVSCSIHEEFGLVAIEMMMHKLPLIVTNTGGLAEIIEDKIDGIKVPIKKIKS